MIIYNVNNEEFVDSVEIEMSEEDFVSYYGHIVELYDTPAAGYDDFWGDEDNPEMPETYIQTNNETKENIKNMSLELRTKFYNFYETCRSEKKSGISRLLDFFKGK